MKITVFGATGRTGQPFVEQALAAGHSVVALVRTPAKLTVSHPNLTVVQGDVADAQAVSSVISADVDAVVSLLAPVKGQPASMISTAAQDILNAMQHKGISRIIWMSGGGVRFPQDKPQLMDHVMGFLLKTLAAEVLAESEKAARMIAASDRAWTIVRAPRLLDGAHTGNVRVGWVGVDTGMQLNRADAAHFILHELSANRHVRQAPMISN